MTATTARRQFRGLMLFFIIGLVLSGVTAFPLLTELRLLTRLLGVGDAASPAGHSGLAFWILTVRFGLEETSARYPWLAYGTDWLAFGHLVIAAFFVGPLFHPEGSRSILCTGLSACAGVFALALICGPIRGIPLYWRFIDCSFGLFGAVPLLYSLRLLRIIENDAGISPADRGRQRRL